MSKPKKNPSYLSIDNISTRTKKKDFYILQVCYNKLMNQKKQSDLVVVTNLVTPQKIGTLSFVNGKIMGI